MIYTYDNQKLEFKKLNLKKYILILGFIFLSLGFGASEIKTKIVEGEKRIIISENVFTPEKLQEEISKYNFQYPDIIYAQAVLESGNFKSNVFLENNNLFGMKQARSRVTTAKGTSNSHAFYKNWKDSVIDRALYESAYLKGFSRAEYMSYLKQNYAEIKDYDILIQKLITKRQHKKQIKTA